MWIMFRLVMFLGGMGYRLFAMFRPGMHFESLPGGISVSIKNKISARQKKESSEVCLKIKSRVFFRIVPESSWLRFYKSAGLGQEFEVGDREFDDTFYIATEDKGVINKLRGDSELRSSILRLHELGFSRFISDGFGHLFMEIPDTVAPETENFRKDLIKLKTAFEQLPSSSFLDAPLVVIVLVLEVLFYGLSGYAFTNYIAVVFDNSDSYLNVSDFILKGLLTGGVLLSLWFAVILLILRRSSRGILLLYDLTLPFVFVAIVSGFLIFSDLNQTLDASRESLNIAGVEHKFTEVTGSGKSRRTIYYLSLKFLSNPDNLPKKLAVSSLAYGNYSEGGGVEIRVRKGYFQSHYVDSIRVIPYPSDLNKSEIVADPLIINRNVAKKLATWTPSMEPQIRLDGDVSWVQQKYRSGKPLQNEPFIQGRRHGAATYWHENGKPYTTINWVNGQKHGRVKLYYPSGSIEQSLNYRNGQLHGLCVWYDHNGVITNMALYDNGSVVSADIDFLSRIAREVSIDATR